MEALDMCFGHEEPLAFVLEQSQAILFACDYKLLQASDTVRLEYMIFASRRLGMGNQQTLHEDRVRLVEERGLRFEFNLFARIHEKEMTRRLNLRKAYKLVRDKYVHRYPATLSIYHTDRASCAFGSGVECA
jgi:hypothetical protein